MKQVELENLVLNGSKIKTTDEIPTDLTELNGYSSLDKRIKSVEKKATQANDTASNKMDKTNPSGTGSFSLNGSTYYTLGQNAVAVGTSTRATSNSSFAEGSGTAATGVAAHAEGSGTNAGGAYSHAEGGYTSSAGYYSHADGYFVTANRKSQHAFGEYNIIETGAAATKGTYVEIVGNGTASNKRSNARTLDWNGNEELAGNIIVKGGKIGDGNNATYKLALPDTTNWIEDKVIATTDNIGATNVTVTQGYSEYTYYTAFSTTADYEGYYVLYNDEYTLVTSSNKDSLNITAGTTPAYTPGNATTSGAYVPGTKTIDLVKGKTFVEVNDIDTALSTTSKNPIQNKVIAELIPAQASASNQVADKNFVNSSIATNTAHFIGTFANITALNNYAGTITNNDYANVINQELDFQTTTAMNNYDKSLLTNYDYAWVVNGAKFDLYRFDILTQTWVSRATSIAKTDVSLINAYNRYTYNGTTSQWSWNYTINTTGFTAVQWAAINSGITDTLVSQINTNASNITSLTSNKANKSTITEYTLAAASWSNNSYTLSITGKTASNNALVSNSNSGTTDADVLANANAISDANIYRIIDNGTSLTFKCETTPTVDLKIQVEVFE